MLYYYLPSFNNDIFVSLICMAVLSYARSVPTRARGNYWMPLVSCLNMPIFYRRGIQ